MTAPGVPAAPAVADVRPAARTFKPRRRSLSPARSARYAEGRARWGLTTAGPLLDLEATFGSNGPFVLDVGFGDGGALIDVARRRPQECVIGVEVHTPGLASVLEAVDALALVNVRVVDGDALEVVERIRPASLDGVRMFFPDPWPKHRQRHRRIVRPDVVRALAERLRPGGLLHLATDVDDYAREMASVCAADGRLIGGAGLRPPWRPVTRFERRGAEAGRRSTDLVYVRAPAPG